MLSGRSDDGSMPGNLLWSGVAVVGDPGDGGLLRLCAAHADITMSAAS